MGRAESEDCQPASASLLHNVNSLPLIARSAQLVQPLILCFHPKSHIFTQTKLIGVKHLPNIITALRIAAAIGLLFCNATEWQFWTLYSLCGVSDMIDGWLARKHHAESKAGSILDSVADLSFVVSCAICLFPLLPIPSWLLIWAGIIAIIKVINQISAWTIIRRFCFPHTIANKLTGLLLFVSVPLIRLSIIPLAIVAAIATFAAIQEGFYFRTSKWL